MSSKSYLNSKKLIVVLSAIIVIQFLFLVMKEVKATSVSTLSGTYGCLYNANFSGFVARAKIDLTTLNLVNSLFTMTFTPGSTTVAYRGITNSVNYLFESNYARNHPDTSYSGTATYTANNPATNFFKITDTSTGVPLDSYFLVVNSGNTIMFLDALTGSRNASGVCQLL